jgi:hypothetical protein
MSRPTGRGVAARLRPDGQGPAFLAQADKMKVEIDPTPGEEVQRISNQILPTPSDIVQLAIDVSVAAPRCQLPVSAASANRTYSCSRGTQE